MNIQNAKTRLNLFIRKMLRVLKLEANVNGIKNMRSHQIFNLISKSIKVLVRKPAVNWKEICDQAKVNDETRINWLDRRIVRKQLDIMSAYHYVQNQGKLMMQSRENGQKPQFGQFFDDFEVKYLQIANFSEK